jgi:hypothetical protein
VAKVETKVCQRADERGNAIAVGFIERLRQQDEEVDIRMGILLLAPIAA